VFPKTGNDIGLDLCTEFVQRLEFSREARKISHLLHVIDFIDFFELPLFVAGVGNPWGKRVEGVLPQTVHKLIHRKCA
jgi:hypothetical protein